MFDYHTHTIFSGDASDGMDDVIGAAIDAGLDEIAITDHFDPEYSDTSWYEDLDMDAYARSLDAAVKRYAERIRVIRGVEAGMQAGRANRLIEAALASYDFDFVIASVHSAGSLAIDTPPYMDARDRLVAVRDYYAAMIDCLREFDDFDVVGHFNVIDRYINVLPEEEDYWDMADEALRLIVSGGKGLEVNTKSWWIWKGRHVTPTLRILKRYVELGGETVTTGSDAHSARDVGKYLKEGEDFIRAAGLRYIATFRNRKISYIRI
jgi:histidinol-phosphatase (PHP family)